VRGLLSIQASRDRNFARVMFYWSQVYPMNSAKIALRVVNHISAMVAFWDRDQKCVFANSAYLDWFGRSSEEMKGIAMKELLGPLYEKNLPYILAALRGEKQIFERQIPLPQGGFRESIATYTPEIVDGVVLGFSAHVADVTLLRDRERALEKALREKEQAQAEAQTLRGLLPICAGCKSIRDGNNEWRTLEEYVSQRAEVTFTHGMCPACMAKYYPGLPIVGQS
jgi:PAS domain S-box-containing protein